VTRYRGRWLTAPLGVVVALACSSPAQARIYWANQASTSIGAANADGTGVNQSLIGGASAPVGVAVDGVHIYWAHGGGSGRIGRAKLDGSEVNQAFVTTAAPPQGVAVDALSVYWTQTVSGAGHVAFAALDGSAVNQSYLPTGPAPCGVAVDPDKEYWADGGDPGSIGRAHGAFTPTQGFVTGVRDPCGVADTPTYVYWASRAGNAIGRARVDGTETVQTFLSLPSPCGVAVDGAHIYWSSPASGTIGRANLDGSGANPNFITGAQSPCGIAVDASVDPSPPSYAFPTTRVGGGSSQAFFIRDSSSSPLAVTRVAFAGPDRGDFVVIGDSCLVSVTPTAGGCIVNVRFTPTGEGRRRGSLRVISSASNSPTDIPLTGVATDPRPPRFRAAAVRPPTLRLSSRSRRAPGATFAYTLSKRARVTFTIQRASAGRVLAGRCRPSRAGRARGRRCTLLLRVGRLVRSSHGGPNRKRFSGRIGRRLLGRGRYRVRMSATDQAGRRSQPRIVRFRVV